MCASTGARRRSTSSAVARWWFAASAIVILLGIISLGTRGLNLGIDFKGGQSWLVTSPTLTVAQATSAAESAGVTQPTVVQLTNQVNHTKQIQVTVDLNSKPPAERAAIENKVQDALAAAAHTTPDNVNFNDVGPTWGGQVTKKAIEALIVFFIAVTLYISVRFEFKMAVAAIVAVVHDILVTVGHLLARRVPGDPGHGGRRAHRARATRSTTPWWCSTEYGTTPRVSARPDASPTPRWSTCR